MRVFTDEIKQVLTGGRCLADEHINVAQRVLQNRFPHISGMQDTRLCQNDGFCPQNHEYLQIHYVEGNHEWVTSSSFRQEL